MINGWGDSSLQPRLRTSTFTLTYLMLLLCPIFLFFLAVPGLEHSLQLEPLHQLFFCDGVFQDMVSHTLFAKAGFETGFS
jgi:hypothetical protein